MHGRWSPYFLGIGLIRAHSNGACGSSPACCLSLLASVLACLTAPLANEAQSFGASREFPGGVPADQIMALAKEAQDGLGSLTRPIGAGDPRGSGGADPDVQPFPSPGWKARYALGCNVEATAGIEPAYTDLQSAA